LPATIGEVGNEENSLRSIGKAGAPRWRGIRPTVRGVAMNPSIIRTAAAKARRRPASIQSVRGAPDQGVSHA
jgi:hypothetical protein